MKFQFTERSQKSLKSSTGVPKVMICDPLQEKSESDIALDDYNKRMSFKQDNLFEL